MTNVKKFMAENADEIEQAIREYLNDLNRAPDYESMVTERTVLGARMHGLLEAAGQIPVNAQKLHHDHFAKFE